MPVLWIGGRDVYFLRRRASCYKGLDEGYRSENDKYVFLSKAGAEPLFVLVPEGLVVGGGENPEYANFVPVDFVSEDPPALCRAGPEQHGESTELFDQFSSGLVILVRLD